MDVFQLFSSNMEKTSIFPRFFISLGMPSLILKMDVFHVSMVTQNRDCVLVVSGSKYGENINFSKVFHRFECATTNPKNGCFPCQKWMFSMFSCLGGSW